MDMSRFKVIRAWYDRLYVRLGLADRGRRFALMALAALALLGFLDVARYLVWPGVAGLAKENPGITAMMRYREGQIKGSGGNAKLTKKWVPLSRISPYVVKAVIIAEDDKFWSHEGFDFEAIGKALERDIEKRQFRFGGSTISQQLAKNLFLSPSKNPVRKLKEAILTWRLERALTKRRILEMYLNVAEWGDGIFGIEAASRHYYGIPASGLGPEQAASLAAVLPNPRRMSPVNPSRYVKNRARIILRVMEKRGVVIPEYREVMQPSAAPAEEPAVVNGTEQIMENRTGIPELPVMAPVTSTAQ